MSAIVNKIANFIGFDMEEDVDYMEVNEKQEEKVVKFNELRNKKNQQKIYTQEVFEYVLLHLKSYEDVTKDTDVASKILNNEQGLILLLNKGLKR